MHKDERAPGNGEVMTAPQPDLATIVAWMRLIPLNRRVFAVSLREASQLHGVEPELLHELIDLGMPVRNDGGEMRLDSRDLANIALHLRLRSIQRRAMESWRQTLEMTSRLSRARFVLEYSARCTQSGHRGGQRFQLLVPPGDHVEWVEGSQNVSMALERPTRWPELPERIREISDCVSDLRFFLVPPPLRDDVGFARETRLAGCGIAGRLIMEECRDREVDARLSFGLLLALPYATPHVWTEVRVEGEWVPFDPHLLRTLSYHAGLDGRAWPPTRSPGAVLTRLADSRRPLAEHDGHPAEATVVTRLQTPQEDP
jgi:hypothetical protein